MQQNPAVALYDYWHHRFPYEQPVDYELARERFDEYVQGWRGDATAPVMTDRQLEYESIRNLRYYNWLKLARFVGVKIIGWSNRHLVDPSYENENPDTDVFQPIYRLVYQTPQMYNPYPVMDLWPNGDFTIRSTWPQHVFREHTFLDIQNIARRLRLCVKTTPDNRVEPLKFKDFQRRRPYYELGLFGDNNDELRLVQSTTNPQDWLIDASDAMSPFGSTRQRIQEARLPAEARYDRYQHMAEVAHTPKPLRRTTPKRLQEYVEALVPHFSVYEPIRLKEATTHGSNVMESSPVDQQAGVAAR